MATRRTGYVQIEVSEILNEIDDDDLLDEVASRKLTLAGGEAYDQDLVREAYNELRVGRAKEAAAILDRLLNPKWKSTADCAAEYFKTYGKML